MPASSKSGKPGPDVSLAFRSTGDILVAAAMEMGEQMRRAAQVVRAGKTEAEVKTPPSCCDGDKMRASKGHKTTKDLLDVWRVELGDWSLIYLGNDKNWEPGTTRRMRYLLERGRWVHGDLYMPTADDIRSFGARPNWARIVAPLRAKGLDPRTVFDVMEMTDGPAQGRGTGAEEPPAKYKTKDDGVGNLKREPSDVSKVQQAISVLIARVYDKGQKLDMSELAAMVKCSRQNLYKNSMLRKAYQLYRVGNTAALVKVYGKEPADWTIEQGQTGGGRRAQPQAARLRREHDDN